MDSKSQAKRAAIAAWALSCGVTLASPAFSEESPSLRLSQPTPIKLVVRKGKECDEWVYQMSDGSHQTYDHKLPKIDDDRIWAEKMIQTPTFRRYNKVAKAVKPLADVGILLTQILIWTL